ncbi:MAG: type II toxin-antitoxin system RelE/ParE family toxin [Klebsiella pneumoniae]
MKIVWSKTADKPFSKIDKEKRGRGGKKFPYQKKIFLPQNPHPVVLEIHLWDPGRPLVVAVKRRTTTTYLHEEHTEYDYSVHQG